MQPSTVTTTLLTPFRSAVGPDGLIETSIDEPRLAFEVKRQLAAGIGAVAVAGWVGEGPTLTRSERATIVQTAARAASGRASVLAHVGTSDTAKSIALAGDAAHAGADGLVVVTPYYNKPNFAGFKGHVASIVRTTSLPVHLEFDPGRTNMRFSAEEMTSLAAIEGVAGIIDHAPNPTDVRALRLCLPSLKIVTGHDPSGVTSSIFRTDGLFSAIANFAPVHIREIRAACELQHFDRARQMHEDLLPLMLAVEEEGVAALKYAMRLRFTMDCVVRLPLVPLSRSARRRVEAAVERVGEAPLHLAIRRVAEDVQ